MRNLFFMLFILTVSFSVTNAEVQLAKASYYADKFHGRKAANGSIYHRDSLTCAHKTLPFGTVLRVTNPKNQKSVLVTVTDRGPFIKGRTVDLSYAAAHKIGTIQAGVANVEIENLGVGHKKKESVIERVQVNQLSFIQPPSSFTITVQDNIKIDLENLLTLNFNSPILIKAV